MIWYAIRFYCKDMKKTNSHQSCLFELKWYIISTISILVSECYFLIIGFPQTCTCQDFRAYDYAKHTFLHWKWKKIIFVQKLYLIICQTLHAFLST